MKLFLLSLPRNLINCFRGWNILWHIIAIVLTFIVVISGLDWRYYLTTRSPVLRAWMFPAVHIGGSLPILLPLALIALGGLGRSARTAHTGWAIAQAEIIAAGIAAAYKAVTGRPHPPHEVGADVSHVFQFGFLRGGVFWGWPSSHTTIAFAMAVTVFMLFPKQRWLGCAAILYALYVGLGVSMTIHWFSDFGAGAIYGSAVGVVVGKCFLLGHRDAPVASPQEQSLHPV